MPEEVPRSRVPVEIVETGSQHDQGDKPDPGTALCLSGGGYRAMVFHVGSLWRLYEAGLLKDVKRISSVSGGSITAAFLGLRWKDLSFDPKAIRDDFVPHIVQPIRRLASTTIDTWAILLGLFWFGTISGRVAAAYRKHLFGTATLQDLPDEPRFVINATNVQSGALWRFSKPYMADWRVGLARKPSVELAVAVAASSAFPPVLSPCKLRTTESDFEPGSGKGLQRPPYTTRVVLADGGVYDNLGLETAWKNYKTILVSDAGGKLEPEKKPKGDWARQAYRVLSLIDDQVRSLRKRQLIDSYKADEKDAHSREGAYWGIRTNIKHYKLSDPLPCPVEKTIELANTPTRLKRLDERLQEQLINWGYAVTDAALRQHVDQSIARGQFPYPAAGV